MSTPLVEMMDFKHIKLKVTEWKQSPGFYGPIKTVELTGDQHTWRDQLIETVNAIRIRGNSWRFQNAKGEDEDYVAWFGRIEWPILK